MKFSEQSAESRRKCVLPVDDRVIVSVPMLVKALVYSYFALPIVLIIVFMVWQLRRIRHKTKWPISDKLLRPPGESLRRKLEEMDERWVFYFLGVLVAWLTCLGVLLKIQ